MPRIPESNARYRTKDVIAADLAFVLKAPLSYGTKHAVASEICWVWTEFNGKTKGCRYWSKMAMLAQATDAKAKLIHEHVVPKSVVIKMLFELGNPSQEDIYLLLDEFLIAVVVTPEEDAVLREFRSTMPPEFFDENSSAFQDVWARYKRTPIEVVDRTDDW